MSQLTTNVFLCMLISTFLLSCSNASKKNENISSIEQTDIYDPTKQDYNFLECMYDDAYFPDFLVDKCKNILVELCYHIEQEKPKDLDALYVLTHAATNKLNDLQNEFFENNSEIETAARECLALDFEYIVTTYGFDADIEELIATREW